LPILAASPLWGQFKIADYRHWLEYDSVTLAVLLAGIGFVELIVLSF
jgi:hypothetical protein